MVELVQVGVNTTVDGDSDMIYETTVRKLEEVSKRVFDRLVWRWSCRRKDRQHFGKSGIIDSGALHGFHVWCI